jgi:hypothetical protein
MFDPYFGHQGEIMPQTLPDSTRNSGVIHRDDEYSILVEKSSHGLEGLRAPLNVIERLVEHNDRKTLVTEKSSNICTDELAILEVALSGLRNCGVGVIDSHNFHTQAATFSFQKAISAARIQNHPATSILPHEIRNRRVPAFLQRYVQTVPTLIHAIPESRCIVFFIAIIKEEISGNFPRELKKAMHLVSVPF